MGKREDIQLDRLREGLRQIDELLEGGKSAWDPEFRTWRDRVQRGLNALFGDESDYAQQFNDFSFKLHLTSDRWDASDHERWQRGLTRSRNLLEDAIEVFEEAPEAFPDKEEAPAAPGEAAPVYKLVLEQTNTVTQMQTLSFEQVVQSIGQLGIPEAEAQEARRLAEEFQQEAEGEQRWSRLGEIAGQLRDLGQEVYERVAVPLLLAWIKQEAGLA